MSAAIEQSYNIYTTIYINIQHMYTRMYVCIQISRLSKFVYYPPSMFYEGKYC